MTEDQIKNVVYRIADILGPDADASRVESLARAVIESTTETPAEPSATQMHSGTMSPGRRVIVTAYGCDAPGILAEITRIVSASGANILDVSQKILQGYFTLIMIVDTAMISGSVQEFQEALAEVAEHLEIRILVQHEELFNAMHRP